MYGQKSFFDKEAFYGKTSLRQYPLKLAISDWLQGYNWDFFISQTFKTPRLDALRCHNAVNRILTDKFGATRQFSVAERHSKGDYHLHILSRHVFDPVLPASSIWKYLFKSFGRVSVQPINSILAVTRYCSKYVTKDNALDYQIYGDSAAWKFDRY